MTEQILKDFFKPKKPVQTDKASKSFDLSKIVNDLRSPLINASTIINADDGYGEVGMADKHIPMIEITDDLESLDAIYLTIAKLKYNIRTFVGGIVVSRENVEDYTEFDFLELFKQEATKAYNEIRTAEICKKLGELDVTSVNGIDQVNNELAKLSNMVDKNIVMTASALASLQSENKNLFIDKEANTSNYFYSDGVFVVDDELLGDKGSKKIFIGSLFETIVLTERGKDYIKWVENNTAYSGNLLFYTRFDVVLKSREAGKMLELSA
ncbi:capsid protein [Streptococcus satellite phage Javan250]|uniref:hypothetical protein n=1 Tax=Streptococcus halotolerans TaxID=1814128 RepID=UPI00078851DF|nr:hypothetical protein [Streptococcus halotolerans]QBX08337.1 capsid protein [Streptococcus satellite phage Javan250]